MAAAEVDCTRFVGSGVVQQAPGFQDSGRGDRTRQPRQRPTLSEVLGAYPDYNDRMNRTGTGILLATRSRLLDEFTLVDNAAVAGFYSQLTGVLAGFAFAGLVLILTHRLDNVNRPLDSAKQCTAERVALQHATTAAMTLLFSAFLGLVLASLSYAVIAGGPDIQGRGSLGHVVAGAGFGAASLILLLALYVLLSTISPGLGWQLRIVVGLAFPFVVMVYIHGGVQEVSALPQASDAVGRAADTALVALAFFLTPAYLSSLTLRRLLRGCALKPVPLSAYSVIAILGVAVPLVASLAIPVLINQPLSAPLPTTWAYIALWMSLGLNAVVGAFCLAT